MVTYFRHSKNVELRLLVNKIDLTYDCCFPAAVLSQDESQGREELNVLSEIVARAEGPDPLNLHFLDLRHL